MREEGDHALMLVVVVGGRVGHLGLGHGWSSSPAVGQRPPGQASEVERNGKRDKPRGAAPRVTQGLQRNTARTAEGSTHGRGQAHPSGACGRSARREGRKGRRGDGARRGAEGDENLYDEADDDGGRGTARERHEQDGGEPTKTGQEGRKRAERQRRSGGRGSAQPMPRRPDAEPLAWSWARRGPSPGAVAGDDAGGDGERKQRRGKEK